MRDQDVDSLLANAGLALPPDQKVEVRGNDPVLTNRYRVGEIAAVTLAMVGSASAQLWRDRGGSDQQVGVDVRSASAAIASMSFDRIDGQVPQRNMPATTAMYQCRDGDWIHLQGSLPNLHKGTVALLGCGDSRDEIAKAVGKWDAFELEEELAARKMCAARIRTADEWRDHPHGSVITATPTVEIIKVADAPPKSLPSGSRPLSRVRVLELARVLAGPTCGRTLAEHGSDVLNVISPDVPNIARCELNVSHGKRSTYLDVRRPSELERLRQLAETADVLVNSYRSGSLDRRGFDPYELGEANPGLVYVSVNCYGHVGPWKERGGFEQMAQSVSGLVVGQSNGGPPVEMPALRPGHQIRHTAPNDYITGFLGAYGAMEALRRRSREGGSWWVRVSLSQTAAWMERSGMVPGAEDAAGIEDDEVRLLTTPMHLGQLRHLAPVVEMSETPPHYELAPPRTGSDEAVWVA